MKPSEVTIEWLQKQNYQIQNIYKAPTIEGVILKDLNVLLDGRGDLIELWSRSWVEKEGFEIANHCYQSGTDHGVIKGWHLHAIHTDQFTVTRGKIQIVLVDIRPDSPTFGHVNSIFMGTEKARLLKIPSGILHGWKALSNPEVLVVNFQSHPYDAQDEFKFTWNCILETIWEPKNA